MPVFRGEHKPRDRVISTALVSLVSSQPCRPTVRRNQGMDGRRAVQQTPRKAKSNPVALHP